MQELERAVKERRKGARCTTVFDYCVLVGSSDKRLARMSFGLGHPLYRNDIMRHQHQAGKKEEQHKEEEATNIGLMNVLCVIRQLTCPSFDIVHSCLYEKKITRRNTTRN